MAKGFNMEGVDGSSNHQGYQLQQDIQEFNPQKALVLALGVDALKV